MIKGRIFILALSLAVLTSGCATVAENAKCIAGISTKTLEKNRKSAVIKTINHDYFICYTRSLDILKRIGAYVYVQDIKKHMIAVYISEIDTTPVGLFFKEIDKDSTQVEVSSPSTYAKEFIAAKLVKGFQPEQKEGQSDDEEAGDK